MIFSIYILFVISTKVNKLVKEFENKPSTSSNPHLSESSSSEDITRSEQINVDVHHSSNLENKNNVITSESINKTDKDSNINYDTIISIDSNGKPNEDKVITSESALIKNTNESLNKNNNKTIKEDSLCTSILLDCCSCLSCVFGP